MQAALAPIPAAYNFSVQFVAGPKLVSVPQRPVDRPVERQVEQQDAGLPILLRSALIVAGALAGWALPIALASLFV